MHGVTIEGMVSVLYDVVVMPKVRRPMALGFKTDELQHVVSMGGREQYFCIFASPSGRGRHDSGG